MRFTAAIVATALLALVQPSCQTPSPGSIVGRAASKSNIASVIVTETLTTYKVLINKNYSYNGIFSIAADWSLTIVHAPTLVSTHSTLTSTVSATATSYATTTGAKSKATALTTTVTINGGTTQLNLVGSSTTGTTRKASSTSTTTHVASTTASGATCSYTASASSSTLNVLVADATVPNTESIYQACGSLCSTTSGCASFSVYHAWDAPTCTLYSASVEAQLTNLNQITSGKLWDISVYYDASCWTALPSTAQCDIVTAGANEAAWLESDTYGASSVAGCAEACYELSTECGSYAYNPSVMPAGDACVIFYGPLSTPGWFNGTGVVDTGYFYVWDAYC